MTERWEIVTQHTHEIARYGYGDKEYKRTLEHLRRRGDTQATVRHGEHGAWRTVNLNPKIGRPW